MLHEGSAQVVGVSCNKWDTGKGGVELARTHREVLHTYASKTRFVAEIYV